MNTLDLQLTLTCTSLEKSNWFIAGSYTSNGDMRGQREAVVIAEDCVALFKSNKQK
jgi:hypothetical protein